MQTEKFIFAKLVCNIKKKILHLQLGSWVFELKKFYVLNRMYIFIEHILIFLSSRSKRWSEWSWRKNPWCWFSKPMCCVCIFWTRPHGKYLNCWGNPCQRTSYGCHAQKECTQEKRSIYVCRFPKTFNCS